MRLRARAAEPAAESAGWAPAPGESERVVRMWEPIRFRVGSKYRYFPRGILFRAANASIRSFARLVFGPIDRRFFRLRVEGRENIALLRGDRPGLDPLGRALSIFGRGRPGAVVVSNHVHFVDCVWVAASLGRRDVRVLSLAANFRIPLVRHLVRLLGGFPLPESGREMPRFAAAVKERVSAGGFIHIYPEGVLVPYCGNLRPFRRGAFLLAAETGAAILPAVIVFRRPDGLLRALRRRPCPTLVFLAPIHPRQGADPREESRRLMEETWAAMRAAELERRR